MKQERQEGGVHPDAAFHVVMKDDDDRIVMIEEFDRNGESIQRTYASETPLVD